MAKKKAKAEKKVKAENLPEQPVTDEPVDLFIGGEEDDLMDMQYVQDETTETHDTHPPETEEEAELRATAKELDDPTPPEEVKEEPVQSDDADEVDTDDEGGEEDVPEGGAADDPAEAEPDPRIPKDRFDEVNERMKAAEEKVKQLEQQLDVTIEDKTPEPEPEPYDYAAKDQEAMDALLEGDAKRYGEIQAEIRQAARDEAVWETKKLVAEGDDQVRESLTFEEAAAKIEEDYPQFTEGSEVFDQAAYDELMDLYVGYAQSGRYTRVDAMRRAADKAVKIHGLSKADEPAPETPPDNVVDIKPDVAAKARIAEKQPPKKQSGGHEQEEPRVDVSSMPDEQFKALPESTKRRLRGDVL
jgi:hypothetical protein